MPVDINSFALNLELTLQDKATAALRTITNTAASLGTSIQKNQALFASMGNAAKTTGTTMSKWFTKATSTLSTVPDNLLNVRDAMQKFMVGDQKMDDKRLKMSKMLFFFTKQDGDTKKKNAAVANRYTTLRAKYEREYQEKVNKFGAKSLKGYKGELLNKQQLGKLSKKELKQYFEIAKTREKMAISGEREKDAKKMAVTGDKERLGVVGRLTKWADNLADMGGKVKASFTGLFSGIGLGEIAAATSMLGLFDAGVLKVAQRQEKFHTINYRQLGTVDALTNSIIHLGKESNLTMDELENTTIALREMGATATEIENLRDNVGLMQRSTGASTKVLAKMSKQLGFVTKDEKAAGREMVMMSRYGKEFALSGSDMDNVLGAIGESSYQIGSMGAGSIDSYNRALMQGAAAAKQMGQPVSTATDLLAKMSGRFDQIAYLGRESMMWDPATKMAESAKKAAADMARLDKMKFGSMERIQAEQELIARMGEGYGVQNEQQLYKTLQLMSQYGKVQKDVAKQGQELTKGPETLVDQNKELTMQAKDALTDQRRLDIATSRTLANIQEKMEPIRKIFRDVMDMFLSDPVYPALAAWGVIGLTVGGILFSVITGIGLGIVSLAATVVSAGITIASTVFNVVVGALSLIPKVISFGIGAFKTMWSVASSTFSAIAGLAGGVGPLLLMMGQAALVVGSAMAGWKIGRWIDQMTGFGDSVDRVNKGQGTFWDYAKTYSNPIGLLSAGYKKLLDYSNSYSDAKEREIRLSRAEAKNKFVVQKLDLQAAARKAAVAGDQQRVDAITNQITELNKLEQEEYANTAEAKKIIEANRLKAQQDMEIKAADTVKAQTEAKTDDATKQIEDLMKKMKEMASPVAQKGFEYAKAGFESMKPMLDEAGTMLSDGIKSAANYIGPAFEKIGPMLQDSFSKIPEYAGPAAEKFAVAIKAAMLDIGPKMKEIFTGLAAHEEKIAEQKPQARAETIVTVKLDGQTGRRKDEAQVERLDQSYAILVAQLEVLKLIVGKLDDQTAQEIASLLKRYLPDVSQNTGLASSANQWIA